MGPGALTRANSVTPAEAPHSGRSWDWSRVLSSPLVLPLILLITVAVFAPTAHNWFWGDDFWLLRSSQRTPIGAFIVEAFDYRDREPVPSFAFYRPLYVITFRLCYAAFELNAVSYHALSITLHLASVVLVWVIARRLLQSVFAANFASMIFALHPAYTETVQGIARGNTVMVTFVYLLTLLAFMKYVDGGSRRLLYYAASIMGFAAAVLYHTTALSLIAVLPAYVFLIARRPPEALTPRWWLRLAPFIAIAAVMMLIQTRDDVGLQQAFKIGWHQYPSFGQYLGYALFPMLPEDWLWLDLPRLRLLTYLSMAGSLVMIGATLVLLDRRQWPYHGVFTALWLYVALAPNTTFLGGAIPPQLYLTGACLGVFFVLVARRVKEMLPADLLRLTSVFVPLLLPVFFAGYIALSLHHLREDDVFVRENGAFIARLRERVPPLTPGSTLYVVDPPFNLVVFGNDALDAAVELYYGDVTVQPVSAQEAVTIRAADPAAFIFDNS